MAILYADGFDQYATTTDMTTVGWTIGSMIIPAPTSPFSQGQAIRLTSSIVSTYNWGSNETTVYGSVFFANTGASSSSQYVYLSFTDAGTAQCTVRWNMDGSIGLYTGGPTGTLISTTTGVFTGGTSGVWTSYQFKLVINNTTGSMEIRVNGAPTNTITATNVNTRGGTSNSYVNGLSISTSGASGSGYVDNFYLTTTGWPGEMRALQQYPTTVVTPNFSVFPTTTTQVPTVTSTFIPTNASIVHYCPFVAAVTGTVGSLTFVMNSNMTGNVKFAIYDSTGSGGTPGALLATSSTVNNPTTATNTATFSSPPSFMIGSTYYLAADQDATAGYLGGNILNSYATTTAFGSFPLSAVTGTTGPSSLSCPKATFQIATNNSSGVQELIEDGDTTYIYTSSNVEDKYNMSSAVAANYAVTAVQYYAMWKKADVGTRTASLSVAANGSADTNLITVVPTLTYAYTIKTLELDPTGAAWTPTNVNGAVIGVTGG